MDVFYVRPFFKSLCNLQNSSYRVSKKKNICPAAEKKKTLLGRPIFTLNLDGKGGGQQTRATKIPDNDRSSYSSPRKEGEKMKITPDYGSAASLTILLFGTVP